MNETEIINLISTNSKEIIIKTNSLKKLTNYYYILTNINVKNKSKESMYYLITGIIHANAWGKACHNFINQ